MRAREDKVDWRIMGCHIVASVSKQQSRTTDGLRTSSTQKFGPIRFYTYLLDACRASRGLISGSAINISIAFYANRWYRKSVNNKHKCRIEKVAPSTQFTTLNPSAQTDVIFPKPKHTLRTILSHGLIRIYIRERAQKGVNFGWLRIRNGTGK